jgi:hypothetical protein
MLDRLRNSIKVGYDDYQLSRKSSKVVSALNDYYRYVDGRHSPSSNIMSTLQSGRGSRTELQDETDLTMSSIPTEELVKSSGVDGRPRVRP